MSLDLGVFLLRLVIGGLLVGHGAQKLFGWFGGYGFAGTRGWIEGTLRLRPAGFWTLMAGLTEFGGGLLFAAGLLSPFGSLGIIAAMLTAALLAHWPRFWAAQNGFEFPLVLLVVAAAVAITGPGAWSLDEALDLSLPAPATFIAGLGAVALGFLATLASRAPAEPVQASGMADRTAA